MQTSYRLVVGLGNPSVTETSLTLHNVYGVPYIPGQALKGVIRSYYLQQYYDIENDKFLDSFENDFMKDSDKLEYNPESIYKYIFGDDFYGENNVKGNVIFYDTFPGYNVTIEKDVMTPHYSNYFTKNDAPNDSFNPVPIFFYTIKDTEFCFLISVKKILESDMYKELIKNNFIKKLENFIKNARIEHGVGAKKLVGYGYFKHLDNSGTKNKQKNDEEELNGKIQKYAKNIINIIYIIKIIKTKQEKRDNYSFTR